MRVVRRALVASLPGAALFLLAACGPATKKVSLKADPPMPPAAVYPQLPLTVGVVFPEALTNYRAIGTRTSYRQGQAQTVTDYDVDFGDFHRRLLEHVLRATFAGVVVLPGREQPPPQVQAFVEPTVLSVAYGGGALIRYGLALQRLDGSEITSVTGGSISAEHKPEEQWIALAIRDAAAALMVQLAKDEDLARWMSGAGAKTAARGPAS